MKTRPTQFGARENTASSGQHASRLAMSGMQSCEPNLVPRESGPSVAQTPLKPTSGATVEEEENDSPEYMVTPRISVVEHYVGASEAAKFLSIHSRTLTQMARRGDIPAHPLGNGQRRVWRFLLSELDVWMRERVHSRCRPCSPKRREM